MPRRQKRKMTLIEWLIMMAIAGILFSLSAPSRQANRRHRSHPAVTPAAAPRPGGSPVELPQTAKAERPRIGGVWVSRGAQELIAVVATFLLAESLRRRAKPRQKHPAETPTPPHS